MTDDLRFHALPTDVVRAYQNGALDAYGHKPETRLSGGWGFPCRHCLTDIAEGEAVLVLAHRPFEGEQPYAETGPIFLHATPCERYAESGETPPLFLTREQMIVRGYGADQRIVYGTGKVVPTTEIASAASAILARDDIAFVDVRSATNNCYQARITRPDVRSERNTTGT